MSRLYNDSVHGHIYLPEYLFLWIDTPEFQRLRRINQLGTVSFVFEGATHNRFSHSIGVAYLANRFLNTILNEGMDTISKETIEDITVAGLLHDIGHGPFSHLFEQCMRKYVDDYKHEDMSCRVIDYMYKKYKRSLKPRYTEKRIEFIKSLILGEVPENYEKSKLWHYEIISNHKTSIDVDKFDYFQRDTKHANIQLTYNPVRFMNGFKIIDGHITYPKKELVNIYELYHTRYVLFKTVYFHKTVNAIDMMIYDIFTSIDLSNYTEDLELFLTLGDDFLHTFRDHEVYQRLMSRDLYKVVWEKTYKDDSYKNVVDYLGKIYKNAHISIKKVNYTSSDKNPLFQVPFCDKQGKIVYFEDLEDKMLVSEYFEEKIVRVIK